MRPTSPVARLPRFALSLLLPVVAAAAVPASAQDAGYGRTVIQTENVRYAYAQVLRVTPVYQTLTATAIERRCEGGQEPQEDSRLSRMVGKVRDAFTPEPEEGEEVPAGSDDVDTAECVAVPVERQYRRPIAYDVDYVYKGARYRSRLPEDPGNRLRIRIGVTPVVSSSR